MWWVSLLSVASAGDPEALGAAQAKMVWESDSHVRFSSGDPRVVQVAFVVSLAHGALSVRWDQPLETVGIAPLMVPVELPTEPVDTSWPEERRVEVLVSGRLIDGEGSTIGRVDAPLRYLVWSDGVVQLLAEGVPEELHTEEPPVVTPRTRDRSGGSR